MREKWQKQMPLVDPRSDHPQAQELEVISNIIRSKPTICEYLLQDLSKNRPATSRSGANGMSADQVLRAAIVKILFSFTYVDLAFHIVDSRTLRRFCQIGIADKGFKKSVLNKNIKAISDRTWEAINKEILGYAGDNGIEKGREVRIDCTVVESNIHKPYDSVLLWDGVRVLTRLLYCAKQAVGRLYFQDHTRCAKKRMVAIQYAKNEKARKPLYQDLLKVSHKSLGYARSAIDLLSQSPSATVSTMCLTLDLKQFASLTAKVIDQTERRVLQGQKVPAADKITSLFEPHTDVIVKDRRDTFYGHKVCLTGGKSNLILDCQIAEGNPADTTLTEIMLDRQNALYSRYPLKVALDGGFASKDNLAMAKSKSIKDVCFAKKRGLVLTPGKKHPAIDG
jgi:IS5 family transposase